MSIRFSFFLAKRPLCFLPSCCISNTLRRDKTIYDSQESKYSNANFRVSKRTRNYFDEALAGAGVMQTTSMYACVRCDVCAKTCPGASDRLRNSLVSRLHREWVNRTRQPANRRIIFRLLTLLRAFLARVQFPVRPFRFPRLPFRNHGFEFWRTIVAARMPLIVRRPQIGRICRKGDCSIKALTPRSVAVIFQTHFILDSKSRCDRSNQQKFPYPALFHLFVFGNVEYQSPRARVRGKLQSRNTKCGAVRIILLCKFR